ncbi:MAG: diguanylate cyclase [Eubacteriales bacterium]|nr:diguanylate cyclase [Eubacteriales bacterium]
MQKITFLWKVIFLMLLILILFWGFNTVYADFAEKPYKNIIKFEHLSLNEGISSNTIVSIAKDRNGIMWIATNKGLNSYDGINTKTYKYDVNNSNSISSNSIRNILIDSTGNIWIATNIGLNKFDPETEIFTRFLHDESDPDSIAQNSIYQLAEDEEGNIWITTQSAGLDCLNTKSGVFKHFRYNPYDSGSLSSNNLNDVIVDKTNTVWCSGRDGINKLNQKTGKFSRFLEGIEILDILEDSKNNIWFASLNNGLYKMGINSTAIKNYRNNPQDENSISSDFCYSLFEDSQKNIWIGTDGGGLNEYDAKSDAFINYHHDAADPFSLSSNTITVITNDVNDNLWIGTYRDGINIYKKSPFANYRNNPTNQSVINNNIINSITEDALGQIWVTTEEGGITKFDQKTEILTSYDKFDGTPLGQCTYVAADSMGNIWILSKNNGLYKLNQYTNNLENYPTIQGDGIFIDSKNNIWITYNGLFLLDQEKLKLIDYKDLPNNPIGDTEMDILLEDKDHILWIGLDNKGLIRFDASKNEFKQYKYNVYKPGSLPSNQVRAICQDQDGIFWLATDDGLCSFNQEKEVFSTYLLNDGFPTNNITGIIENNGILWITSNVGLIRLNIKNKSFVKYDTHTGLLSNAQRTIYKTKSGKMILGNNEGISIFNPENMTLKNGMPNIIVTEFRKGNTQINVLNKSEIRVSYKENSIFFEMAVIDYKNPSQNKYAYKLEGYDKDWVYSGTRRTANYQQLPGGSYSLHIKGANSDGVWNVDGIKINVVVETPPWISWWACTLYVLGALIILIIALRYYIHYRNKKNELEIIKQREISEKLIVLDKLKDEFLANTSHELRTPLNGIIGITESLIHGAAGNLSEFTIKNLSMVVHSGKRLANLINDILDYCKLKNHELVLQCKPVDIYQISEIVITILIPLLNQKSIEIKNEIPENMSFAYGDEGRIEQIMYNLLGNAIKYTDSGSIIVSANEKDGFIEITVFDTGIGIPEEKLERIFISFEQADASISREYEGTGLGLSLTKKLVELHGGHIWVESEVGKGSKFTFTLKVSCEKSNDASELDEISKTKDKYVNIYPLHNFAAIAKNEQPQMPPQNVHSNEVGQKKILVVDDEFINLQVLVNQLSIENYVVTAATNGIDALELIENGEEFDLVLLDIMMPKMSGYEVCKRIRMKYSLLDLPVIILTAKNQSEDILAGFEAGANDFLVKPFDQKVLIARANTLLSLKQAVNEAITASQKLESEKTERILAENLRDLSNALSSVLILSDVLQIMLEKLENLISFDFAVVILSEKSEFKIVAVLDKIKALYSTELELNDIQRRAIVEITGNQQPIVVSDILKHNQNPDYQLLIFDCDTRSWMGVPLVFHGQLQGLLIVESHTPDMYKTHQSSIASTFASQSVIAIENSRLFEQVQHNAITEELTGLNNRRHLLELTKKLIDISKRNGCMNALSALMIDIDNFKYFNDNYGHDTGDEVLSTISRVIKSNLREMDIIGRYGGEEFLAILPNTDAKSAMEAAERIRESVEQLVISCGKYSNLKATISIGVAILDDPNLTIDSLVKNADEALYYSKKTGRNKVSLFEFHVE